MKLIQFDFFLNVKVLTNSFVLKYVYVPFGNCKYYFLSFIWFELLSFEHGNPISHKM